MDLIEAIKQKVLKFLKTNEIGDPLDDRLTFINNSDNLRKTALNEYRVWYFGDSNELLNYYQHRSVYGDAQDPIYNRNRRNYFWEISTEEASIKRVHSGIPNAIVATLTNIVGMPKIESRDEKTNAIVRAIINENDLKYIINQQQIPMTLVEGWGAFKINIDKSLSNLPIIQYYEANSVEFVVKCNKTIGIIYKDYYEHGKRKYVLLETRRVANGNSYIEYELFEIKVGGEVEPVSLGTIPELANYENIEIKGYNKILGVPSKFFYDPLNKHYGRSIFTGKIDLFDDLDQILSQDSQTVRVSTPVEYYPVDLLERNANGNPEMPKVYNRQYVKRSAIPNGDGETNSQITTTQPQLNFDQYSRDARAKLDYIITGILSPASMGIDISKKDNAEAQREKEKVTIMTRDSIIDRDTIIYRSLMEICLDMAEYMETGSITLNKSYDLSINFDEFANPSFETELKDLGQAWAGGQISTYRYVKMLWGDKLSDEELESEVKWLDENRARDDIDVRDFEDYGQKASGRDLQQEKEASKEAPSD